MYRYIQEYEQTLYLLRAMKTVIRVITWGVDYSRMDCLYVHSPTCICIMTSQQQEHSQEEL